MKGICQHSVFFFLVLLHDFFGPPPFYVIFVLVEHILQPQKAFSRKPKIIPHLFTFFLAVHVFYSTYPF